MNKRNLILLFLTLGIAASAVLNIYAILHIAEIEKLLSEKDEDMEKMKDDYYTLDANLISLNDLNVHMTKELEMFRHPDTRIYKLASDNVVFEESEVIICWNEKEFSLLVSAAGFPKIAEEKVFILWAISEGKYTRAAVLPRTMNGNFQSISTDIKKVDGFIITIESSQEIQSPSLNEPYLSGNQ